MAPKNRTKKKAEAVDLHTFLDGLSAKFDWGEDLELKLPVGPRSDQDVWSVLKKELFPTVAPFIVVLDNAPFDVDQATMQKFLEKNKVTNYTTLKENTPFDSPSGRGKNAPTIEFKNRSDMLAAVALLWNQVRMVSIKTVEQMTQGDGRPGFNQNMDRNRNQDHNNSDMNIPDGEWRSMRNPDPLPTTSRPPGRNNNNQNPQQDVAFVRNMDIKNTERSSRSDDRRGDFPPPSQFSNQGFNQPGNLDELPRGPSGDRPPRTYQTPYGDAPPPGYDSRPPRRDNFGGRDRDFNRSNDRDDVPFVRAPYNAAQNDADFRRPPPPNSQQQQADNFNPRNFQNNNNDKSPSFNNSGENFAFVRSNIQPSAPPPPRPVAEPRPVPTTASRPTPPQPPKPEPLKERPKIIVLPKSTNLPAAVEEKAASSIFGGARPVDTQSKMRQVEDKLEKERGEKERVQRERGEKIAVERAEKEKLRRENSQSSQSSSQFDGATPRQLLTHKGPVNIQPLHDNAPRRGFDQYPPQQRHQKPVASVPPYRPEQNSPTARFPPAKINQNQSKYRADEAALKPEPDRALATSNRFADLHLEEQESNDESGSMILRKDPPSTSVRQDSRSEEEFEEKRRYSGEEVGLGADEEQEMEDAEFQVVGGKKKQVSRPLGRGGARNAPPASSRGGGMRGFEGSRRGGNY